MNKEWFEEQFNTTDNTDKWGHQFRATQKIRFQKSFDLIKSHIKDSYTICDLCCGFGDFLNRFKIKNLYGFDISTNAINKAKSLYPHIKFTCNELPNTPKNCDIVIALECIYYIQIDTAVEQIYYSLNQDGLFLVSVPIDYEKELFTAMQRFTIIKIDYTYFGLFSQIEPKLLFYSKSLDFILDKKIMRKKYLLKKLYEKYPMFITWLMGIVQKLSLFILKNESIVRLSSLFRIKRHIIIVGQK